MNKFRLKVVFIFRFIMFCCCLSCMRQPDCTEPFLLKGVYITPPMNLLSTKNLFDIHFSNARIGHIAASEGTVFVTLDSGYSYSEMTNIGKNIDLYGVSFSSISEGWVVGDDDTIYKTTDAGVNWTPVGFPYVGYSYHDILHAQNKIWIVGGSSLKNGLILSSSDNGQSWDNLTTVSLPTVYTVDFISSDTGFVGCYSGKIFFTKDQGNHWTEATVALSPSVSKNVVICNITMVDKITGYAVGYTDNLDNKFILKTIDGGYNWALLSINTPNYSSVDKLTCITPMGNNVVYVCGGNSKTNTGRIFYSSDGGLSWSDINPHNSNLLYKSFFTGWKTYFVGSNGSYLRE